MSVEAWVALGTLAVIVVGGLIGFTSTVAIHSTDLKNFKEMVREKHKAWDSKFREVFRRLDHQHDRISDLEAGPDPNKRRRRDVLRLEHRDSPPDQTESGTV